MSSPENHLLYVIEGEQTAPASYISDGRLEAIYYKGARYVRDRPSLASRAVKTLGHAAFQVLDKVWIKVDELIGPPPVRGYDEIHHGPYRGAE